VPKAKLTPEQQQELTYKQKNLSDIAVTIETDLAHHCALELFSAFMFEITAYFKYVGGRTTTSETSGYGDYWSNELITALAEVVAEAGLVEDKDDALPILIPAFATRGLLPTELTKGDTVIWNTFDQLEAGYEVTQEHPEAALWDLQYTRMPTSDATNSPSVEPEVIGTAMPPPMGSGSIHSQPTQRGIFASSNRELNVLEDPQPNVGDGIGPAEALPRPTITNGDATRTLVASPVTSDANTTWRSDGIETLVDEHEYRPWQR
jgi:hypothetical protein